MIGFERRRLGWLPLALGLGVVGGCAQPPHEELALAGRRVERARQVDAHVFAPRSIESAEAALRQAEQSVLERGSYRSALRSATRAVRDADDAYRKASVLRAIATRRAERLVREMESLLDMAASRGASTESAEFLALREQVAAIARRFEAGALVETIEAGEALKPALIELERRFREAGATS